MRSTKLLCLVVLIAALGTGCQRGRPGAIVAINDMIRLTDAPVEGDSDFYHEGVIRQFAAANETVAFQLVGDGTEGAGGMQLFLGALRGPDGEIIPADRLRAWRMAPVTIDSYPPWYIRLAEQAPPQRIHAYDVLIPIKSNQSFDVPKGQRLGLWIDVAVPRTARPGRYTGTVELTWGRGGRWTATLELKVYDIVLPDAQPMAALGATDHRDLFRLLVRRDGGRFIPSALHRRQASVTEGLAHLRRLMVLAQDHRVDLFETAIAPELKRARDGSVNLDWEDYDAIVGPYLEGYMFEDKRGVPAWPIPFRETWPEPERYGGMDSQSYAKTARSVLAACAEHFQRDPFAGRMFAWPQRREPSPDAYEQFMQLSELAATAAPDIPVMSRLPLSPPPATGWNPPSAIQEFVDIYAPPAHWVQPQRLGEEASSLFDGGWLSAGTPPYLPPVGALAEPADLRALPWFAWKYGASALFLSDVLKWEDDVPAKEPVEGLFYPGPSYDAKGVLPSVRLKWLRRGMQDVLYLQLLRLGQRLAIARTVSNGMVRYGGLDAAGEHYLDVRLEGWVRNPKAWRTARQILAEEVQAVVHPDSVSRQQLIEARLRWQRFDEKAQRLRIERKTGRVDVAPQRLTAHIRLDLRNEYSRSADVTATVEELPQGWSATNSPAQTRIRPNGSATIELSAAGEIVPATSDGKPSANVKLSMASGPTRRLPVPLPFLMAGEAPWAMQIDGRLDDWPLRPGNSAGNFVLLGRRGLQGDGLANRQTQAFVLRDDERIYIAFRCQEPHLDNLLARSTNRVEYRQLLAVGEDLVEVLLDPGRDAKGPGEFYHAIVKSNGVAIFERGVRSDPPLGPAGPWAADAEVAVGRGEGLWTVELAIPLSSFGPRRGASSWGVNFTRYATQGVEASSWTGVRRNFYDPDALGTLLMASPRKPTIEP